MYFRLFAITYGLLAACCVGRAQPNLVLYRSSPGDYIGAGATYLTTNIGDFRIMGSTDTFHISAFGFEAYFDAPDQGSLTVGSYTNAVRWPFNGSLPGLSVFGNGRGCNAACGNFEILELATDTGGQIVRLWLTFTHICECGGAPLRGEIRYGSQLAPAMPSSRTLWVPSEYDSIQAAIDDANVLPGDTVLVSPGIYNESIQFKGKRVRVVSAAGPSTTFINPPSGATAVAFGNGESAEAIFQGFTITNAALGVSISDSSPSILSNIFLNCGGGIDSYFASPIIRGNRISESGGDGIHLGGAATALIEGNIIETNAIAISMFAAGTPIIRNNIIRGNRSDGLNMVNHSDADVIQNLIVGNLGSGISWLVPSGARGPLVVNNTIVKNIGPAIFADGYDAGASIINNILVGSPALSVGGFNDGNPPIIRFNDVYSSTGSAYSGMVTNLTGIAGNISANPLFTCFPEDDFQLLSVSPCIDAGTNGAAQLPQWDFAGGARIVDGNTNGPSVVDMGAFEVQPATRTIPCLYINCPSNILAVAPPGQSSLAVTYPAPTGSPLSSVTSSPPSGTVFPAGTNLVTCTATYASNTASCTFNVIVLVHPMIVAQPQDTNVLAGQSLALSVTPAGSPPFAYRWMFEGLNINGATNATLSIPNAQASHEGIYRVIVSNTAGSVTSTVARVRVLPSAPVIAAQPTSLSVPASSNATFSVTANGSQPLAYRWLFNEAAVAGATGPQYTVTNVQALNAGSYRVVVMNALGAATSSVATLSVMASAPYFVTHPRDAFVPTGTNLTLTALARGSEPIGYQWRRNGVDLPGANQASLSLSNISLSTTGSYAVIASNIAGFGTSEVAQVTVYQPASLQRGLTNEVVLVGETATLSVLVGGNPEPRYTWEFNGAVIPFTNSTVTLTNRQPWQSGYYRVVASNIYGNVASTARVSVLNVPSSVAAWGDNTARQVDVPEGLDDVVATAGGDFHSLALRRNGSIMAWGYNGDGQAAPPTNALRFVAIAAGAAHNLAIADNGLVAAWGRNDFGQANVPASATSVLNLAAGESHSLALLASGRVIAWGDNSFGQVSGSVNLTGCGAIAAGRNHSLALRTNGTVAAWGFNAYGQASPPQTLSNAVAVAAGYLHSVALRSNGTVVVWGDNTYGQCEVPAGLSNVMAVAAGDFHTYAMRQDGSLVAWGDDSFGQMRLPRNLSNTVAVASGYYHGLALGKVLPQLRYALTSTGLVLEWTGGGILQSALSVTGPFADIPALSGSYTNSDFQSPMKFFRLRR